MGAPQIIVLIWCVIGFIINLCKLCAKADRENMTSGATVLAVFFLIIISGLFQLLLLLGGFYG